MIERKLAPEGRLEQLNNREGRVMSVLVTGGAGYIGSVAVEQLCDAGHQVVVYDNLYKGHKGAVDPRAHFVEGDLVDLPLLEFSRRSHKIQA